MNKRQAKKRRKKEWDLYECYVKSYTELKKLNRAYKEYCIEVERKRKKCLDCQYYDSWEDWLYFDPCCYCPKV